MRREVIFRKPIHAGPLADCLTVKEIFFGGWKSADLLELFAVHQRIRASQLSER